MNQNYDPQELAKFASHAHHWWDETGELKTLHQINPLRLHFILEKTQLAHKHVIDIGCGGGILSESMSKLGAHVTGIDMDPSVIDVAKLHLYESKLQIEYLCTSAEAIASERKEQYDVVTCFEMLEHVPDPAAIIAACSQLLKPNGHLFVSTINRNPKAYAFAIVGAEYILKLLPKNTHDYAKFIRPSELSQWLRASHLQTRALKGISYKPFTKQFQLTQDISVNYLLYAQKSNP